MPRKTTVTRRPTRLPEWEVLCPGDTKPHIVRQMGIGRTCDCDGWYRSHVRKDPYQCAHTRAITEFNRVLQKKPDVV